MPIRTNTIWVAACLLLAIAVFAWVGYLANGIAYADTFGIRGAEAALALTRARTIGFLTLALIAEGIGVGITIWQVLNDHEMSLRIAAAAGIAVLAVVCTFAFVRSF